MTASNIKKFTGVDLELDAETMEYVSKKIQSDIVKMQASGQFDKTIENYKKHGVW